MADQIAWTKVLGQAFTSDRNAVFASIQKLRLQAKNVGTLKSSPQQSVETKTTSAGQEVIVIEPTNPQIVYVPQYNTEVVYTQAPTQVVVIEEDDDDAAEAIAAGLIGFTAGIVIGATMDNNYYYGPYGFHGGGYMYNDAWDDYYDHVKTRARTGRTTARTSSRSAAIARRIDRNSGPSAPARPGAAHGTSTDAAGESDRRRNEPRRANERTPTNARRDARDDVTGTTLGAHRQSPKPRLRRRQQEPGSEAGATQRQLGRILGILERTIATLVQRSGQQSRGSSRGGGGGGRRR
jgi:hypothetical protein